MKEEETELQPVIDDRQEFWIVAVKYESDKMFCSIFDDRESAIGYKADGRKRIYKIKIATSDF